MPGVPLRHDAAARAAPSTRSTVDATPEAGGRHPPETVGYGWSDEPAGAIPAGWCSIWNRHRPAKTGFCSMKRLTPLACGEPGCSGAGPVRSRRNSIGCVWLLVRGWPMPEWDDSSSCRVHRRILNAHHHAGTTRMHEDPRGGVVDQDLRVHGLENLFVAGGSVFPRAGWANPTLTIVALSLRLADHLSLLLTGG